MRHILLTVAISVALLGFARAPAPAQEATDPHIGPETKLPMPRYVSLRSGKVNMRRGPGLDYRIDWVFQRSGLPVRVIDEYGHWRQISDADDTVGWVFHALLTSRRMALITETQATLRARPEDAAEPSAYAEQGVVAQLKECRPTWCLVEARGAEGWIRKEAIWGVDAAEVFGG